MKTIKRIFLKIKLWHLAQQIDEAFDRELSLRIDAVLNKLEGAR